MNARDPLPRTARRRPPARRRGDGHAAVLARRPAAGHLDELVATRPELISAIHREYLDGGRGPRSRPPRSARTGRARPVRPRRPGRPPRPARRASSPARRATSPGATCSWRARSGRSGAPNRELLHLREADVRAALREQIDGLLEGGVDLFMFETFSLLDHLLIAIDEARRAGRTCRSSPSSRSATSIAAARRHAAGRPRLRAGRVPDADVVGVNCGGGPGGCPDALEAMAPPARRAGARSILPNAGLPAADRGPVRVRRGPGLLRAAWSTTCSPPAPRSSVGAAGPRPSTSRRCESPRSIAGARRDRRRPAPARRRATGRGSAAIVTAERRRAPGATDDARRPPASRRHWPPGASSSRSRSTRRARSASSAPSRPPGCSRTSGVDTSTSAIRPWRASGWARWRSRSASSTTSTSSASSTSRRATGT